MTDDKSYQAARTLSEVAKDGFRAADLESDRIHPDLAFTSARLALQAFAGTAAAIHGSLHVTDSGTQAEEQRNRDFQLGSRYRDAAFETIVHFQHFAELIVKDTLRRDHELLVVLTGDDHEVLHRLLHGEPVQSDTDGRLQSVEASLALRRICALQKAGRFDSSVDYIVKNRKFLEVLNGLRNRLWHRGTYTLRYTALDELVGRFALPFLRQVCEQPPYKQRSQAVELRPLACGIRPFDEIVNELAKPRWSVPKVAFLKELARAAYANPFVESSWFERDNERLCRRAELIAEQFPEHTVAEVISCPVCGSNACLLYLTSDIVEDDNGYEHSVDWTWLAKCEACTLELRDSYGNPSEHGWTSIPELWRTG